MPSSTVRAAAHELLSVLSLTVGFGESSAESEVRKGARYVLLQTVLAIAAGAALAAGRSLLTDSGRVWPVTVLVLYLPLAAVLFRTPSWRAARLSLPAGVVAGVVAWLVLQFTLSGFWLVFAVSAVAVLVAGPLYGGVVAGRRP